jgi:hypothetical protein
MASFSALIFSFFMLLASIASAADINFRWTFPVIGKDDYFFANGDKAIVSWNPADHVIPQIALNCSGTAKVYGHATATGIEFEDATSPSIYNVNWVPGGKSRL